jgi:nucleotide-binding universal stress UspA family protein
MIKNILVALTGFESDKCSLQTAFLAARLFDGHIIALHVRPNPAQPIPALVPAGAEIAVGTAELIEAQEREAAARMAAARRLFEDICTRQQAALKPTARHAVSAEWRDTEGDLLERTIAEARFNDLVVLCRGDEAGGFSVGDIGALVVSCGRPVLLAPNPAPSDVGAAVVIAWKETAEAARAVTAAMPFFAKADRTIVVMAEEDGGDPTSCIASTDHLVQQLRRHGFPAEGTCVVPANRSIPDAVLDTARELGADLLVSGAYSHSRTREMLFGSFTRQMLKTSDLPVLLFH